MKILLPPLSRRREDILLLLDHFIRGINAKTGKEISGVSAEVMGLLMRYEFPGNVRELENIVEHAFILCRADTIQMEHLPNELLSGKSSASEHESSAPSSPLLHAEAKTILEALQKHNGHRGSTASYLGIDKSTLWRKMKKYRLFNAATHAGEAQQQPEPPLPS